MGITVMPMLSSSNLRVEPFSRDNDGEERCPMTGQHASEYSDVDTVIQCSGVLWACQVLPLAGNAL